MAQLMAEQGILAIGGWGDVLYHGYFTQRNSDPWFLYHVLLVPLTQFSPAVAQKIIILLSVVLLSSVFIAACRHLKLSPLSTSVLLAILLLGNIQFTLRAFLARPALILSALTVLCYLLILKRQWELLFGLLVFCTLLSHLFVIPLFILALCVLWHWSRFQDAEGFVLAFIVMSAVLLGIWLHPQSQNYLHYLATIFTKLPFLLHLDVGTEMKSGFGREATLLAMLGVITLALLAGIAQHKATLRLYHEQGITLLGSIVGIMCAGFFIWVRMIDFLWPFCLLFLATIISLQPYSISKTLPELLPKKLRHPHVYLLVLMIILGTHTGKLFHTYWQDDAHKSLEPARAALHTIPSGTKVLNVDWDVFPMLMSVRPDLQYARGMDPGFNFLLDRRSEQLFANTIERTHPAAWYKHALEVFPDTEVFVLWSHRHPELLALFRSTPALQTVYPQDTISVFKIQ